MDLTQIAELKDKITEELRRIEALKQSMEHTLAGLIEWEKQLQGGTRGPVKSPKRRPVVVKEVYPKPQGVIGTADITPSERVNEALVAIHGEFTRSQLLAEAEGDGKGNISAGAYGHIFSRLLKKQRILCVKASRNQRDSLYMRSSERRPNEAPLS
jgi:hypothetical protein